MNWIVASLLMFLSSIITYLLIRKATFSGLDLSITNLAIFFVPLIIYAPLAIKTNANLLLSLPHFLLLFILSFFCAYISNTASLSSIKYAPNPGYSLILSKSYVVFTTIAAVIFLKASLNVKSIMAILIIVGFSSLIMIGKVKKNTQTNPIWLPYALISFFGWGLLSIGTKYAFDIGINVYQRLIYVSIFVSIFIIIEMIVKKTRIKKTSVAQIIILSAIGFFSGLFNYFMMFALDAAPNIGYVNAINTSSISMVTIFSAILFKDELTIKKFIGVLGVTTGLILLIV